MNLRGILHVLVTELLSLMLKIKRFVLQSLVVATCAWAEVKNSWSACARLELAACYPCFMECVQNNAALFWIMACPKVFCISQLFHNFSLHSTLSCFHICNFSYAGALISVSTNLIAYPTPGRAGL